MKYSKFIYRLSQGNASRVFQGGGNRRHGGQLRRGGAASLRPHGHGGGRALAAARRGFAGSVSLNLNPRLSAATKFSEAKKSCVYSYSELLFEYGPDFLDTKLETYPVLQCVACYSANKKGLYVQEVLYNFHSIHTGMRIRFWPKNGSGALYLKRREIFKGL